MKTIVISLGGSLIVPDKIDIQFLKKFKKSILNFVKKGNKAIIVCGGGKTCRNYYKAAEKIKKISNIELDKLGIKATAINAELLRVIFGKKAYKEVVPDYNTKNLKFKILFGCGHLPGSSSDLDAVMWAKNYKADYMINLSNTNYIYTKDPNKYKDAKKLETLTWNQLQKIIGTKWVSGLNAPFDPTAIKLAKKLKLKVIFLNGRNLKNFENFLNGKEFKASVVS